MYIQKRFRILRNNPAIRSLVAETILTPSDFILPLFIDEGENVVFEIPSMTGYYRRSLDGTIKEVKELWGMGIKSVLLFIRMDVAAARKVMFSSYFYLMIVFLSLLFDKA